MAKLFSNKFRKPVYLMSIPCFFCVYKLKFTKLVWPEYYCKTILSYRELHLVHLMPVTCLQELLVILIKVL